MGTYVTWSYLRQTYIYLPLLKANSSTSHKVLQICVNSVWTELLNKIRSGIIPDFFLQVVTFCQDSKKTTHNKNTCFETSLDSCFPRLIFLVSVSGCCSSLTRDPTSACNGLDCIPCALQPTGFLFTGKAVVGCGRKSKPKRQDWKSRPKMKRERQNTQVNKHPHQIHPIIKTPAHSYKTN